MDPTLKYYALLLLLGLVLVDASSSRTDLGYCEKVVKKWTFSSLEQEFKEDKHTLKDLLFFLHVPRTGGRTYFHCFLRKLYSSSLECPRSYDKLRFDPCKQKCRLLVTHDDYSVMSKLPSEKTSVVTILRDPVDRVFSAYEFSIEVAARFLMHPNLTSATQIAGRLRSKTRGVSTLDIWPWKYLVPWMREDLFARREGGKYRDLDEVRSNDVYNMEEIVMPLHEYIYDPIARDIIHNGATFQIAGLTNNSYTAESHAVRHCVQKYKYLGQYVLQVAKKRLDNMLYVGLTEEHRESATMFANVVGSQVISQLRASNSKESEAYKKTERNSSFSNPELNKNNHQNRTSVQEESEIVSPENGEAIKQNMTAVELMDAYEECTSNLRKTQSARRTSSLKRIYPVNFTKEARRQVPEVVLQQIKSLNHLDLELYKYSQKIFAKQNTRANNRLVSMESWGSLLNRSYDITLWEILWLGITVLLLMFILVFVNARRRMSKIKI